MTEGVENLILEHLKVLRNDLQALRGEETREPFAELRAWLNTVAERLALVGRSIANVHGDLGAVHVRPDRLESRIERHLELTAA
jgi:hypothetical protein